MKGIRLRTAQVMKLEYMRKRSQTPMIRLQEKYMYYMFNYHMLNLPFCVIRQHIL